VMPLSVGSIKYDICLVLMSVRNWPLFVNLNANTGCNFLYIFNICSLAL
jgi:hypothetical protein